MLTGRQLFHGETVSDILASVLKDDPNLEGVPEKVRPLLKRCLEKDPKKRLQAIGDWELLLEIGARPQFAVAPAHSLRGGGRLGRAPWGVAALLLIAVTVLGFVHFREKLPVTPEVMRFQIELPDKVTVRRGGVLSPDGRKMVFPAVGADGVQHLWLRSLDALDARVLPTGEGLAGTRPIWSPDSRFVAFDAGGKLKKIDITGGPPQTVCDLNGFVLGGSWNGDGVIILGDAVGGVMRVSAAGGVATLVSGREESYGGFPSFLPDGRHFIYHGRQGGNLGVYVGSLDTQDGQRNSEQLVASPAGPAYAPSSDPATGFLLFLRDDTLTAQPFDTRRMELTGEAVAIAEGVGISNTDGNFSTSANGALLYGGGNGRQARLSWLDRQGKALNAGTATFSVRSLNLSPDAARVAFDTFANNVWIYEFARDTTTRLTFGEEGWPVWSPDGGRIAFVTGRGDRPGLYQKASSGAGNQELLLEGLWTSNLPTDWSSDGRFLLDTSSNPGTKYDLWVLPDPLGKGGDRKPVAFLRTDFNETQGHFSPDTRWIAYRSDESGNNEIYVRPFNPSSPGSSPEGKWMVSKGGGTEPRWRRDGKELFYLSPDGNAIAVEVAASTVFQPGVPKALFQVPPGATIWDVAPDGRRFLLPVLANDSARAPFTLVLNWQAGLKK